MPRIAVFVVVAVVALAAASVPLARNSGSARALCGTERWAVKTLQDRPTLLPVRTVTVGYLTSRPPPAKLPGRRLRFERHIFRVEAAVTLVRREEDGDLHLVLREGPVHMIAEAPLPSCALGATPPRRRQMAHARAAVRLCAVATVIGVAFFDFKHGQMGVAPNAVELHPLLAFRCATTS